MGRIWLFLLCLCVTGPALAQPQNPRITEEELCSTLDEIATGPDRRRATTAAQVAAMACRLPIDDINQAEAEAALNGAFLHVAREGDAFTIVARSSREEAHLCCSLQAPMTRLGDSSYWVVRFRLPDLDRAILSFIPPEFTGRAVPRDRWVSYRGPNAPAAPEVEADIEGRLIDKALWSPELQETRRLVVYLPPDHVQSGDYATLVVADGGSVRYYARMIEPMIDRGEIEPLVLVGVVDGQQGIVEDRSSLNVDLRAADYLPGFEGAGDRFEQHFRFVTETLLPFAEREYAVTRDRTRRGVTGFSNGAVFAYWAGLRRPDLFGAAIVRSLGYDRIRATSDQLANPVRARFFMSAGLYETRFWLATDALAEELRGANYPVAFLSMAAGHAPDQGNYTLAQFVRAAFPAQRR